MKKLLIENRLLTFLIKDEQNLVKEFCFTALLILLSILLPFLGLSQKGKDGDFSTTASTLVNKYVTLASSATAGATSITVSNIAHLSRTDATAPNTNLGTSVYAADALAAGDLVMIIQMQGADMTTTDDAAYGTITAYNNTGNYELKTVLSVAGNVITFCEALTKSYGATGRQRTQVIRVPRFNNLTVSNAAHTISAAAWQGTKGGVCAIEVNGNLVLTGKIDATGAGFRGGAFFSDAVSNFSATGYRTANPNNGTNKGESIYGGSSDYASDGQYGRGAPTNGGGGGNSHNAAGGGGSNAGNNGNLTPWNGTGIKSTSTASWANAWNLEATGFATDVSRGGGRGGYSYASNNQDALTVAPGNALWGGDARRSVGGLGGRPLDYNSNTRLFLGGGGGAGQDNNGTGSAGGNGGGIIYLLVSGTVTGTNFILANGANAANTSGSGNDAPGGGGGGGAVVLLCNSTITSIAINANGGNGGSQVITGDESEGPGGGGGGGYILTTTTGVTKSVSGGSNGTTNSNAITEFIPNGATSGDAGTIATGSYTEINSCFKEINGLNSPSCSYSAITVSAANTILNTYYPATASASAGSTRITIGARNTTGASTPISPGDLLLVIQMQGATINSTNTSAYGAGTTTYSGYLTAVAGTYEYVYAASGVVNNTVYLATPLRNSYTSSAATASAGQYTFQVVRVPEYASLTVNTGSSITASAWNGSSGGIVVANVRGNLALGTGTSIDVSGKGFRGGGAIAQTGAYFAINAVTNSTVNNNSSKGEGIAGTPRYTFNGASVSNNIIEGYPSGSFAMGAPANAGGGSSGPYWGGGGGGSNAGNGGRGGRTWSQPTLDNGGYGGAVFSQASKTRLVMGGGGGAGTTYFSTGALGAATSSGAIGGGIILINAVSLSGTSVINANGNNGLPADNDPGGGGGAGGSFYINAISSAGLANITINAMGGNGGNARPSMPDNGIPNDGSDEAGPGGGGSGGAIYTNGAINGASSVAGGAPGITTTSNLNYFATAGSAGNNSIIATTTVIPVKVYCDIDDDNDGITDVTENPSGVDPFMDADNDGVPNVYDRTSGTVVSWADTNSDGINDSFDADKDGKINELDIDSDNDGITDNVEAQSTSSYVVPTDTDSNGDGLMDIYSPSGLTPFDFDGDGTPDYLDTDSDNDGKPDRYEAVDRNYPTLLTKTQTDIDTSGDTDGDGLMDIFDNVNRDNLTTNYYLNVTMGNMGPSGNFAGPTPTSSLMGLPKSDPTVGADRDWRNTTILPLNIVKFTAVYSEPTAKLSWSVENEYQTAQYEVEYSIDGIHFEKVGEVLAHNVGKADYNFSHVPNKTVSTVYYRIKQIDKSGKAFYSKIVAIKLGKAITTVSVYPNPFVQYVNVSISSPTEESVSLQLISADGKVVKTNNAQLQKGTNIVQMTDLSQLTKGNYYLRIISNDIQTTQQVIKIN